MNGIIKLLLIFIFGIVTSVSYLSIYYFLNIKKEHRFLHYRHMWILIVDIFGISGIYFIIYIVGLFNTNVMYFYNRITSSNIVLILILNIYLLYKLIYMIYYALYEDKIINNNYDRLPKHYYFKDGIYYLSSHYITLSKVFKKICIVIIILLAGFIAILNYLYSISFKEIIEIISSFMILLVLLSELSSYFDGLIEDTKIITRRGKKNNVLWNLLDDEYRRLWKNKLLGSYNVINRYDTKIIDGVSNIDSVSMNITKGISDNNAKDLVYGKILSLISNEKNLIIESCLIESFSNIIIPIINIKFTAGKKIMILTDSYDSVKQCSKWLEKSNITNSDIVVDVLSNNNDNDLIKHDNNVDIYVGTVDLILNNRNAFENIDVVFCLNIDKIITESALDLNLLASFLSGKSDEVQYIMFGNRVNGLMQTISQVFMKNNFEYQTIENGIEKQINVNFWKTEGDWFQTEVLSGIISNNLGEFIPLSLPAFKLGVEKVNIISSEQSLNDQLVSLQTAKHALKKYINKDIVNINDAIILSQNENFIELDKNSVLVVEDNCNNAALVLLNYLKYTKNNMYLNVVTRPYMLRDYIISNIDFFVNNVEVIGNILPLSKTNNKLSLYRIINELCYGFMSEDILLDEIKKIDRDISIDIFENNQQRFITNKLQKLIKDIFGVEIYLKSYLDANKYSKENEVQEKQYYKLLDSIKDELPERLFKNIKFIDTEQSTKILKRIPVFELYQNYLEGQYIVFEGKSYLIDRIDYDNGIVNLVYSNNNDNNCYRQCKQITNINHIGINKELSMLKVNDSTLKKSILCTDFDVNTNGYYMFNNEISFKSGSFGYREIDANKKGLCRKYKSANVLAINISNKNISEMTEENKFKISFTLSVLLNEIFETLFSNIKQYILVRNVVNNENTYSKYKDEELVRLYKPIVDKNISDGINIYITEDTELEKGITDTIIEKFDNVIIPLLHDYIYWLIKEDTIINEDKWYESTGDYINFSKIDKLSFLKYGNEQIYDYLDLNGVFNCLDELIIKGKQRLTNNRIDFVNKRVIDDEFNLSLLDVKEKNNVVKDIEIKSIVKQEEDKSFIERVKEAFKNRKDSTRDKEKTKENKKNRSNGKKVKSVKLN